MKSLLQKVSLSAIALTLAWGGAGLAQPVAQTPLPEPVQTSGTVNPGQSSNCGFIPSAATQVLQVNEDFASVNITVSGSGGLTLLIQGPGGFTECHTTSGPTANINAPGLLNRGSYSFYVGNANQVPTSYSLTISQN
ncbi:MAG TPA: hypothetical protein IGR64_18475 [Leptolyngbyaceae cyanobacterium M65_K2018_010]|nr:hypothetical protein [Leptolyngbyaceae cyanobacterium M65_K2018_010]